MMSAFEESLEKNKKKQQQRKNTKMVIYLHGNTFLNFQRLTHNAQVQMGYAFITNVPDNK